MSDIEILEHLKTNTTEHPVNSAAISLIKDHFILVCGKEAIEVFLNVRQSYCTSTYILVYINFGLNRYI